MVPGTRFHKSTSDLSSPGLNDFTIIFSFISYMLTPFAHMCYTLRNTLPQFSWIKHTQTQISTWSSQYWPTISLCHVIILFIWTLQSHLQYCGARLIRNSRCCIYGIGIWQHKVLNTKCCYRVKLFKRDIGQNWVWWYLLGGLYLTVCWKLALVRKLGVMAESIMIQLNRTYMRY